MVPEGHTIHRLSKDLTKDLDGRRVIATSPQGRFENGASKINGKAFNGSEAWGKHLFLMFSGNAILHIHLGLIGKFRPVSIDSLPTDTVRLRLEGKSAWQLTGPQKCSLISSDEYSLVTKPIDGLTLSAHYYSENDYDDGVTTEQQLQEGGSYALKYAAGNVTVGYGKSFHAPEITTVVGSGAGNTDVEYYENTGMSIGFAVNDDLSVSYTREESERNLANSATLQYDIEMDSLQVAYSLGGATLSIAELTSRM